MGLGFPFLKYIMISTYRFTVCTNVSSVNPFFFDKIYGALEVFICIFLFPVNST